MNTYYIGYDIGSSSVKVALVDANSGAQIVALHEPKGEMMIIAPEKDWAEQDPEVWWKYCCSATKKLIQNSNVHPNQIKGIGISYQMHGLVVVDNDGVPLRNAIIWCDSRAVAIGDKAFSDLGSERCAEHLMNSPGNFTASKLRWVKENEPELFDRIHKFMLPGDYIAYKLTGEIATTSNGLSEGILWDFKNDKPATWLLDHYEIPHDLLPEIVQNFTDQGYVNAVGAQESGLPSGIPVVYRAGDQPNNALSLNVFNHGEVAATGGTSGVLYAVTNNPKSNETLRINNFAHVNYSKKNRSIGKLLCINGAGSQYKWLKNQFNAESYEQMNALAAIVPIGAEGLSVIPFGNGAERMLNNKNVGTHFANLNLNIHTKAHLFRAALEGIAFSFVYGMEILKNDNAVINVIRAGNDNLFQSELFSKTVATLIGHEIEIYNTTGAVGAARAVGLKYADIKDFGASMAKNDLVEIIEPLKQASPYSEAYRNWKKELQIRLKDTS